MAVARIGLPPRNVSGKPTERAAPELSARFVWTAFALILTLSAVLALTRLDHTPFWNDESFVAISARNVVHLHRLTSWDGRNLYAEGDGNFTDANLRNGNPPLDILVAAASFRLFGITTWAGRLPFVLFGLAALSLFWAILRREFPHKPALWLYALASLALSCDFLLNVRCCRYYALALFFSLLIFACWRRCLRTRRAWNFAALSVSVIALFYTHYLLCAAFLIVLVSVHMIFHRRDFTRSDWLKVAGAAVLFVAAVAPYLVVHPVWKYQANLTAAPEAWLPHRATLILWNLNGLNLMGGLPWTVALGLVLLLARGYRHDPLARQACEWAAFGAGYAVALALLSPQPTTAQTFADLRYLIPAMPFLAGLVGLFLWLVHRRSPLVAGTLLVLLVTTNIATLSPGDDPFQWLLPAYVSELTHPYPTANAEVSSFLRENARQDDVVLACPQHLNYPLMFYVGDKVRIGCTLDKATPLPLTAVRRLHAPLLMDENYPNWLVLFGAQRGNLQMLRYFSRSHVEQGRTLAYSYRLVRILPVYWDQTQRPELPWHSFGPVTRYDPATDAVYIFQRVPAR